MTPRQGNNLPFKLVTIPLPALIREESTPTDNEDKLECLWDWIITISDLG